MTDLARIFGVRHFSPAGAFHLRRFLDEVNPEVVLIEGPSDATDQLEHLVHEKTSPPVAVLAFTRTRPVRSVVYLALTYDHRLIDGADAARFLATVKNRLEEGAFEAELGL